MTKSDCLIAGYYDPEYFYTLQKGDSVYFVDRETHKTVCERVTLHDRDGLLYYEWRQFVYWLCFFDGHDIPVIKAAFVAPWLLAEYVKATCDDDRAECFTVFTPQNQVFPLKKFLKTEKEYF